MAARRVREQWAGKGWRAASGTLPSIESSAATLSCLDLCSTEDSNTEMCTAP